MYRLIALLIGYIFGMFQTSYIVGRAKGIDIREHGSKNAGFTNTNRVLGRKAGALVFVCDILKAVAAFVVASLLFDGGGAFFASADILPGIYAGAGAILGHIFPAVLKFKGGKGISCFVGVILMLDWRVALIVFVVGLLAVAIFRYISLTSLLMTLLAPVLLFLFGYEIEAVAVMAGLGVLAWYMHRANILRLLRGEENRFSLSKK
ncbi:MAG: glycerol-3-phosphate 1-O-acyltransferase PlsY [Defluviitaleaceae bacterium]|nr:glycerol-3-phosphate 1-O-acyltransferase PlsY [Defluviitaleaceae bacterium]